MIPECDLIQLWDIGSYLISFYIRARNNIILFYPYHKQNINDILNEASAKDITLLIQNVTIS